MTWFAVACLLTLAETPAWVPLAPCEAGDEPWGGSNAPGPAPPRDGQPVTALRLGLGRTPVVDSPALLQGWQEVAALRFWLHNAEPRSWSLALILVGTGNGYQLTTVPLDFAGWRQITLPIESFKQVREATLREAQRFGFRAQGYGQPALSPELVLWFDQLEVQPRPGSKLVLTNSLEANEAAWRKLAAEGNALAALLAAAYAQPLPSFSAPEPPTNAWTYRGVAERLLSLTWAATDPASPHRGRADLVDHAVAVTSWLVARADPEGWWWQPGTLTGDPNVNRFTLGPLLDAVRGLRTTAAGAAAWPRWQDRLNACVELQRRAYQGQVAWDWGGLAAGEYANQDVYYVLLMELSAQLWERPADRQLAREMLRRVASNLLPDGAIHYIGVEMESPIYHALDLIIIGRYATLTADPAALQLLRDTSSYYPLTCSAEGYPESWSDVWWKQNWGLPWRDGLIVAAGAIADARHRHLLWQNLRRQPPALQDLGTTYALPYWPGLDQGAAPPARWVAADRNIRGLRGRQDDWYFGVTQGRGLRNSFVGAMLTAPARLQPLLAAFRGAQVEVAVSDQPRGNLTLSQIDDRTALARQGDQAVAVAVRYRLQPRLINGVPTPATPDTPWQVTQLWRAAGDGIVGGVAVEAVADTPARSVVVRLALGPQRPVELDGQWTCGPLQIKLLQTFGTVSVQPVPHYTTPLEQTWPGLELRAELTGARAGQRWLAACWLGPPGAQPPREWLWLPAEAGFACQMADGRRCGLLYNPGSRARTDRLPGAAGLGWLGEEGRPVAGRQGAAGWEFETPAGGCLLWQ
ncbi:MAG: hypothetical protein IT204_19250 [Fimbriimonadaceae bacterium]|nr:hypothetical protein [Fimbriimonadaceae bacterium]